MTKINFEKLVKFSVALLFWLAVWEISAILINLDFIFPRIGSTIKALAVLMISKTFWISIIFSILRIIFGFALGVIIGVFSAFLCNKYSIVNAIISPAMTVIKSTPVASVIMLLWFIIGSDTVPIAIAILMVTPIIWQNLLDGFDAIDNDLSEVCQVFDVTYLTRLRILIVPTLTKFLLPAIATASGLAWKSGVAAEIITYTKDSIGQEIIDAKAAFEGAEMFALTITVVILSVIIERLIKLAVRAVIKE